MTTWFCNYSHQCIIHILQLMGFNCWIFCRLRDEKKVRLFVFYLCLFRLRDRIISNSYLLKGNLGIKIGLPTWRLISRVQNTDSTCETASCDKLHEGCIPFRSKVWVRRAHPLPERDSDAAAFKLSTNASLRSLSMSCDCRRPCQNLTWAWWKFHLTGAYCRLNYYETIRLVFQHASSIGGG